MVWTLSDQAGRHHYLIGTMHIGSAEAYAYASLAKEVISKAANYVGEIDLGSARQVDISSAYKMPDGMLVSQMVNKRQYHRMQRIAKCAFGVDIRAIDDMRPMIIQNVLAARLLAQDGMPALDQYLWQHAEDQGCKMGGIESLAEQRFLLEHLPIDLQLYQLRKALGSVTRMRTSIFNVSKVYASGNYQSLYRMTKNSMGGLRRLLIYDRNATMASRMLSMMAEGPSYCFSIGAAHIGGDAGVRALLLRQGYKVKCYDSPF